MPELNFFLGVEPYKLFFKETENGKEIASQENANAFFDAARRNLIQSEIAHAYLKSRGIEPAFAAEIGFGFANESPTLGAENRAHPLWNVNPPAIIFPQYNPETCEYTGAKWRFFDANTLKTPEWLADKERSFGKQHPENLATLTDKGDNAVFVAEGQFDYAALRQAGFNAICLGSAGRVTFLRNYVATHFAAIKHPLIFALDNDSTGEIKTNTALNEPEFSKIRVLKTTFFQGQPKEFLDFCAANAIKDCNDLWRIDKERFKQHAQRLATAAKQLPAIYEKETNLPEIQIVSLGELAGAYFDRLLERQKSPKIPTPFAVLNDYLNGGYRSGELYVLGATASRGKTAFAVQCADFAACAGFNVVFFTLENRFEDLIARILSRRSYIEPQSENSGGNGEPEKPRGRSNTYFLDNPETEQHYFLFKKFKNEAGDRLFFPEGQLGGTFIQQIKDYLQRFLAQGKQPPLLIVDYLQILDDENCDPLRSTAKIKTDNIVSTLKLIALEYHVPIVLISSFNRQAYEKGATMGAFKESGNIEYTADVLLVIEVALNQDKENGDFEADNTNTKETLAAKKANEAFDDLTGRGGAGKVAIKILKNRNGRRTTSQGIPLFYATERHTYYETDPQIEPRPKENQGENPHNIGGNATPFFSFQSGNV